MDGIWQACGRNAKFRATFHDVQQTEAHNLSKKDGTGMTTPETAKLIFDKLE